MTRKRIALAALVAAAVAALTGCGSTGWDALPVDDDGTCYQVSRYDSNGWTTHTSAVGTFCKPGMETAP